MEAGRKILLPQPRLRQSTQNQVRNVIKPSLSIKLRINHDFVHVFERLQLLAFVTVCYEQIFISTYRTFTITAVAQLCILGIMWVFGCFQFGENTLVMSYIFTILSSLQGVLMFIMHCWLSKQVSPVRLITRMQSLDTNMERSIMLWLNIKPRTGNNKTITPGFTIKSSLTLKCTSELFQPKETCTDWS